MTLEFFEESTWNDWKVRFDLVKSKGMNKIKDTKKDLFKYSNDHSEK